MDIDIMLAKAKQEYRKGKFQEAERSYRTILEMAPQNAQAHQGLAQCLNRLGRYQEAVAECARALELDPRLAVPHAILASIYCRQGQFMLAEMEARKAIELDPTLEEAYISLGAILIEQRRFQEAALALHKALQLNSSRSQTHYNLAILYIRQHLFSEALGEAFKAFRLSPSFSTAWLVGLSILARILAFQAAHRFLFASLLLALLLLCFVVRSFFTLPLFLLFVAYGTISVVVLLQSGKRATGSVFLISLLVLIVLYMYNLFYGL